MGVKSTVYISRRDAEERYLDGLMEVYKRKMREDLGKLSNKRLEHLLEIFNDEASGGEGFANYEIVEDSIEEKCMFCIYMEDKCTLAKCFKELEEGEKVIFDLDVLENK